MMLHTRSNSFILQWLKDNALFNMGLKDGEYQREPRWPIEMQVLPDKIRHIDTAFPNPEPFYVKSKHDSYVKLI